MKATIDIPDDLYRRVEAEAALRGLTIREVTTTLYQRWLRSGRGEVEPQPPATESLRFLFEAADEAIGRAPSGPTALEHLEADRNRLEPR
ncbi:MAG: hypothetical protein F4020_03900 [Gammaproteobacteria bacterium]|nr:hypothetical protein [Gammaproteobacteria bacterium]MYK68712.1 hypothetical protein [Gammaproteobacteria bacterium]